MPSTHSPVTIRKMYTTLANQLSDSQPLQPFAPKEK
uniref:Uncharacterized protein n=1 Tax=Anguilla anguilla TaxID=7936 RepID=A0A0E9R2R1_ANGAN